MVLTRSEELDSHSSACTVVLISEAVMSVIPQLAILDIRQVTTQSHLES